MSHDLLANTISALGGRIFNVEIISLIDNTFFANLRILKDGVETLVSARPSDAVALAMRVGAPILVSDDLMNAEGKVMMLDEESEDDEVSPVDEAELVAELREFLDQVNPEDFNK